MNKITPDLERFYLSNLGNSEFLEANLRNEEFFKFIQESLKKDLSLIKKIDRKKMSRSCVKLIDGTLYTYPNNF